LNRADQPASATSPSVAPADAAEFARLITSLRPKMHRYCTRLVGSAIDAEDLLQDVSLRAIEAVQANVPLVNIEAWLFRVLHNASLDFLRRQKRVKAVTSDEDMTAIIDPVDTIYQHEVAATGLQLLMLLPPAQRSSVALKDVLGYSLEEIGAITGNSVQAVKAALHRGRERLRRESHKIGDMPPPNLDDDERARLSRYIKLFNAREFDAVRDMLANDVALELVGKTGLKGLGEVSRYFGNYAGIADWTLALGFVDRRPAILVCDPFGQEQRPVYFMLLSWSDHHVSLIRDFRHARYVVESAEVIFC
jgi:RNA polymerase sigma-70 factor (ECF subfamily)